MQTTNKNRKTQGLRQSQKLVASFDQLFPVQIFGQALAARDHPTIRDIAEHMAQRWNIETFPLVEKKPPKGHEWRTNQKRGSPGVQFASDEVWAQATGYAITPVQGSDLCIIDCDSLIFLQHLFADFPRLVHTSMTFSGDPVLAAQGHCHLFIRLTTPTPPVGIRSLKRSDGSELVSLRAAGAYVVGPGSLHPSSHQRYTSNNIAEPIKFDAHDSARLLALFEPITANGPHTIYRAASRSVDIPDVAALFDQRGYKRSRNWLNGPCIHPDKHRHGDQHASFGVNIISGVGHCFVCGSFAPIEVAGALRLATSPPRGTFAFCNAMRNGLPDLPKDGREPGVHLCVELNLATEMFRRGCYQSARFYDILWADSRAYNGRVMYRTSTLVALGSKYELTRDQTNKALRQMCKQGLLEKVTHGLYRRVGLARIQERLGLGTNFAPVYLPVEIYTGSPAEYTRVILLAIEHYLPKGLATATIGKAAGISRTSTYDHERILGIEREPVTRRVGIAPASDPSFIKVFNAENKFVVTLNGDSTYDACKAADRNKGTTWGWRQWPSYRFLPKLPSCMSV